MNVKGNASPIASQITRTTKPLASPHNKPDQPIQIFTIGFTQKSAEVFFTALLEAGVRRLIDVRLNNVSQLAGFTKRNDLAYFLRQIGKIDYVHLPALAPTQELLNAYRKRGASWDTYADQFLDLLAERQVEEQIASALLDRACLLCSEPTPEHCHRRLVAEYLQQKWGQVAIRHL
jgi:uncharacterized protein (DUF488 family)